MKKYWVRGGLFALGLYIVVGSLIVALSGTPVFEYLLEPLHYFSHMLDIRGLHMMGPIASVAFYAVLFGVGALVGHTIRALKA